MSDSTAVSPITLRPVPFGAIAQPFRHFYFDHEAEGFGRVRVTETLLYLIQRMIRMTEQFEPHTKFHSYNDTRADFYMVRSLHWQRTWLGGKPLIVSNRANDDAVISCATRDGWRDRLDVLNLDDAIDFARSLSLPQKAALTLRKRLFLPTTGRGTCPSNRCRRLTGHGHRSPS